MKKIILFTTLLLTNVLLNSEYIFQYAPKNGNSADFTTTHVSSDFGKRCIKNSSNNWIQAWHKGVDYSNPADSTHLLAIDGGLVEEIYIAADSTYKVIKINGISLDYGFGHIFYDGHPDAINVELSGMKLLRMESPFNHLFTIVVNNTTAISRENGSVINGVDTLNTSNSVNAGDRIAPMGNSGPGPTHVHLYCFKDGFTHGSRAQTKDPLEFLSHAQPNYDITIDSVYTVYPGDSLSSVKVRCKMLNPDGTEPATFNTYNHVTMNIDNVELFITSFYLIPTCKMLIR